MEFNVYLWTKAFHIISIIAWMAGLLYLPRLFVYHTQVKPGSEASEKFKVMEYKLLKYIMNPAMILSFLLGVYLIYLTDSLVFGWMHAKLGLVFILAGIHGMMVKYTRDFANNNNSKSENFFRIFNEIPTIIMILIVIFVVVKPF